MSKFSIIFIGSVFQILFFLSLVCGQAPQDTKELFSPEIQADMEKKKAELAKIEKMMIKFHETRSTDVFKTDGPPKIQETNYLYKVMLKNMITEEDIKNPDNALAKLRQIRQRFLYLGNCELEISAVDKQIEILNIYYEVKEKVENLTTSIEKQLENGAFERGFRSGYNGTRAGYMASDMGFESDSAFLIGLGVAAFNLWASSEQANNEANEYYKEQLNILDKEYTAKQANLVDEFLAILQRLEDKYSYGSYTDEEKKDFASVAQAAQKREDVFVMAFLEDSIYEVTVKMLQELTGGQQSENVSSPLENVERIIGYVASLPDVPLYDEDRKAMLKAALDLIYKARQYGKLDNIMFYQYCWELYLKYDVDSDRVEAQRFWVLLHGQGKSKKAYKVGKRIASKRENDFSFCTRMVSLATENNDFENAFKWLEKMMQLSAGQECVQCLRDSKPFKDENIPYIPENIFNTLKQCNPERYTKIVNLNY